MFQSLALASGRLAGLALAPAMLLGAVPALAAPAPEDGQTDVRTTTVAYGDLNLATASGRHQLDTRLRHAADTVCGVDHGLVDLTEAAARSACCNHALIDARHALARQTTDMTLVRR